MFKRRSDIFLTVTLLMSAAISHFVIATLLIFLLVAMTQIIYTRREIEGYFPSSTLQVSAYATLVAAWLIYGTFQTFRDLVSVWAEIVSNLRWEYFLRELFIVGRSNFGTKVPLWATIVKLFWIIVLIGVGTVIPLLRIRRIRSLPSSEASALGALVGIILLSVTATLVSKAGSQFLRYPMYAPLVTAPLLLLAICRSNERLRRIGLVAMIVSLVIIAVPTFLAHYPAVRMNMYYESEAAPARTLSRFGYSAGLQVIAPALGFVPYIAELPNAHYAPTPVLFGLKDEDGVWAYLDNQVASFAGTPDEQVNLYVFSRRSRIFYRHNFGIPLDAPHWDLIQSRLDKEAEVYDNGFVVLYQSGGAGKGRP